MYVIPTDAPEADGTLAWDKTTLVLVTVRAGDQQGLGWSYAAGAAGAVVTEVLAPVLTGWDALDPAGANEAMTRAVRNIGRPGIAATAISAADIALWDLKGRLLGCSVTDLAGRPGAAYLSTAAADSPATTRARTGPAGRLGGQGPDSPGEDQDR